MTWPWHGIGDQPSRSVPGEVIPGPLDKNQQAVLKLDNVHEVDRQPHQPCEIAAESPRADHGNRSVPTDRGHGSQVAVSKGSCFLSSDSISYRLRTVLALLNGHRSDTGQWFIAAMIEACQVSNSTDCGSCVLSGFAAQLDNSIAINNREMGKAIIQCCFAIELPLAPMLYR